LIEATVWASVVGSGAEPAVEAGADDWTLPLPVVRPAPEPEPVRPEPAATRSRRARRAAEERAAGLPGWVPEPGAYATDRARHGGHRAAEPGGDPVGRAGRRHGSAHGRHSEERDDLVGGPDRPRHRRPEH
jgi:hypothetical protein